MVGKVLCFLALVSSANGLLIGAFNIQVFGKEKARNADVMDTLVKIISRYDLLLIQEIRDKSNESIFQLLDQTNVKNPRKEFSMALSDPLGRTSTKEQYAFFYRVASGLNVTDMYVYADNNDVFERPPYIVTFSSAKAAPDTFTIAGIHVKPGDAVNEIAKLYDVFESIMRDKQAENIMVMGDLNADEPYVQENDWKNIRIRRDRKYTWPINDDTATTLAKEKHAYDRFIYTGSGFKKGAKPFSARVFRFDDEYDLKPSVAKKVSDHYPIELELNSRSMVIYMPISRAEITTSPVLLLVAMLGFCHLV